MKQFRVVVNGNEYKVAIEELAEETSIASSSKAPQKKTTSANPKPAVSAAKAPQAQPKAEAIGNGDGNITAAMPGTILDIKVSVGDTVKRGQALLILEAMKMENEIMASSDGVISEILTTKGASVNSGDLLMILA